MFLSLVVNPRGTDYVVGAELDSIDPHGQEIELGEITLCEVFQGASSPASIVGKWETWLLETPTVPVISGRIFVASGRDAGDEDFEHKQGRPSPRMAS